jgi:uncharacterized membrane protein
MGYALLALIVMVVMGVVDFLMKKAIASGVDFITLTFCIYFSAGIIFGIFCLIKKVPLKMKKNLVKYPVIIGLLTYAGTYFILIALKGGNASVVIPIVRMGFVVTAICAFIFLREKVTPEKALGLLCAAISLVLLSL